MTGIDFEMLTRKASSYAKRHGHPQDAEDFAQECCIYAFESGSDEIYIARRFSDYLRRNYGRKGTPGADARRQAIFVDYDDEAHGAEPQDGRDLDGFGDYLARLSRYERLIYVLRHKYEAPLTQIADCRGVSESRISQELSRIQKAVDQAVARKESGIQRAREEEMARILRSQRERLESTEGQGLARFESFSVESFDEAGL